MLRYHTLSRAQRLAQPPAAVFDYFGDAGNLEALTPPSLRFTIVTPRPIEMRVGALIEYRLRLRGLPIMWLTRIEDWEPGRRFVDVQLAGPYALWHHTHEFKPDGSGGTIMRDRVRYALPWWPASELAHRAFVVRELAAIFDYRREQVARRFSSR